jgi:hypothetical protein
VTTVMLLMAIADSDMTGCRKPSTVSVVVPVVAAYIADVFGLPDLHGGLRGDVRGVGVAAGRGQGGVACCRSSVFREFFFLGFAAGGLLRKGGSGYISMTMSVFLILSVRSPLLARSLSMLSVSMS